MFLYRCKDLVKIYTSQAGDVVGLNHVSLDIAKGEFITIAGPSGSGKSTFANILGLLDTPTEGSILFNDVEISKSKAQDRTLIRRKNMGFIFQSFNLVPVLTAIENVALACELQGTNKQEAHKMAKKILEEVGLRTMLHRFPNQLSGGQQQRVSIARAVVKKPAVLLADEPTASLDSANTKEVIGLLNGLNKQYEITCIVCSHDQRVLDASKRIVYITDGKISSDKILR